MPDLHRPDLTLHYERDGDGPAVLLLAGMLSDSASWGPLVAPLVAAGYRVIRPDNRTTGRTTPWDAQVSVNHMADDALALMDHLGIGRVHLMGHSMGGLIALELAGLAGPDRISSLSILASAPVRVPRTMAVFDSLRDIRRTAQGETLWLKALYPWVFRPEFFADPHNIETAIAAAQAYPYAQPLKAMEHQIEALRSYRPRVDLATLTCPTLTVFAGHDILIPEESAREAFSALPNVTQTRIAEAGHSLHWDAPEAVMSCLLKHLNAHPA